MVNVEKLSENKVKLTVTVSAEDFDKALDRAFEKVVKDVKVDGFRPGKMPKSMFIKRFGYEPLYNDAVDFALQATYYLALNEANVYPTSDPKINLADDVVLEKGKGFDYTVEVDVWPPVHLGEYKGLKIKKSAVRVTKKDIEEYIDKKLKEKSENIIKDGAAELGDTVVIDFEGFVDGVAFEGGKGENHPLELGSNSFIPGFEDQLVGTKAGDEKDVNVKFPENYTAELAGKEATFKCKVHEVKTLSKPELNDEFVEDLEIEGVKTVDAYNDYVKAEIKTQKTNAAEAEFKESCLNAVMEKSYAEFPDSLINSGVERQVQQVQAQAKQYNMPVEVLLQYYGIQNLDEYKKQAEEQVRKQYLAELVFDEIIKLENIEATPEEVEAKYVEIAGGANVEDVKKRYQEAQIAYQVKWDKAVQLILDSVEK